VSREDSLYLLSARFAQYAVNRRQFHLQKFDGDGSFLWRVLSTEIDFATRPTFLALDAVENIYVGGRVNGDAAKMLTMIKSAPDGTEQWRVEQPTESISEEPLFALSSMGVYVADNTNGAASIACYSAQGDLLWQTDFSDPENGCSYFVSLLALVGLNDLLLTGKEVCYVGTTDDDDTGDDQAHDDGLDDDAGDDDDDDNNDDDACGGCVISSADPTFPVAGLMTLLGGLAMWFRRRATVRRETIRVR